MLSVQQSSKNSAAVALSELPHVSALTPALVFKSSLPSIFSLSKDHGEQAIGSAVYLKLAALGRFLNLKNSFTKEQIDYVVDKFLHDAQFKFWKLADLDIIIDRIKSGRCGNLYESMSATKFLTICNDYDAERLQEIERLRREENEAHKAEWKDAKLPYYYEKGDDGRMHIKFTPSHQAKMDAEEAERKAAAKETERKQQVAANIRAEAERIQQETGCDLATAYMKVINKNH